MKNSSANSKSIILKNKEEITTAREEIISLYKVCKKQQRLIEDIENGVYTNGIRSTYVPQKDKPKIPDRYNTKFLNKALNKLKIATSGKDSKLDDYGKGSIAEGDAEDEDSILNEVQKRGSKRFIETSSVPHDSK